MTSNQKLLSLLLGVIALILVIAQFAMAQILTSTAAGEMRLSVLKIHKHSGHLMVVVCVVYILMTMWWMVNSPTRLKADSRRAQ